MLSLSKTPLMPSGPPLRALLAVMTAGHQLLELRAPNQPRCSVDRPHRGVGDLTNRLVLPEA